MPRSGPRQVYKYSTKFKLAAVRLSQVPGPQLITARAGDSAWRQHQRHCGRARAHDTGAC